MNIYPTRKDFLMLFWGMLFVFVDIRFNSIDVILPDFVGYILIFNGLRWLAVTYPSFRRARVLAAVMIFLSLPGLIEVKVSDETGALLKRQLRAALTGDLTVLYPEQIGSATLVSTTNSRDLVDANRSANPERGEDVMRGEYSDGTVVLILRYASSEAALSAMKKKSELDYSPETIRKRGETDESFRADRISMPHGRSGTEEKLISSYANVEVADRVIQQWWNRGARWWDPVSWHDKAGWSNHMLYIVEGYKSTVDIYKAAFSGSASGGGGNTFNPLFPVSMLSEIVGALLIWHICSGIIAASYAENKYDLMNTAGRRRNLYVIFVMAGLAVPATLFVAADLLTEPLKALLLGVGFSCAVVGVVTALLILGLLRKAAKVL